jgi:hypothetical protein
VSPGSNATPAAPVQQVRRKSDRFIVTSCTPQ